MPALADLAWPRTTERLTLRPVTTDDLDPVWAYRCRDDVGRWLGGPTPDRESFAGWFLRPERQARTLVVLLGAHVVGDLMLRVEDGWAQLDVAPQAAGTQAELGWVLDPAHGGRGLATEAVRELLAIALAPAYGGPGGPGGSGVGLGLRRVSATCFADNTASWRLMERVGMRREQHGRRDSLQRDLGWVDGYGYALLAEEWSAMSERD